MKHRSLHRCYSRSYLTATALLCALLAVATREGAAQPLVPSDIDPRIAGFEAHVQMAKSSPFGGLNWSFLGPTNVSGRADDVAVADKDGKRRIYVAFQTGGLWKTDDNGVTWQAALTRAAVPRLTDVAVAASNPDIVWVGTVAGVYKSTDAAATWQHAGLAQAYGVGRIVIHPNDPDIVYVAMDGLNEESRVRALFKTTDGGRTWKSILYRGPRTGAIDLVMDPGDPNTLYVATWQVINHERFGRVNAVDPDSNQTSIWKTTDAGASWTEVANGLPRPRHRGRIGIDISRSNPKVLYALLNSYESLRPATPGERDRFNQPRNTDHFKGAEVYRTDNAGLAWRKVSKTDDRMINHARTFGDEFGQIRVDPQDENTIYTLGVRLHRSRDGGSTFETLFLGMHVDHHGLWIDTLRPDVLYSCTDGGLYLLSGDTPPIRALIPTSQFYNVALDMGSPFRVYGSAQDFGNSWRAAFRLDSARHSLVAKAFASAPGNEASNHIVDPSNPNIVFAEQTQLKGRLHRHDLSAPSFVRTKEITPKVAEGDPPLRGAVLVAAQLSPHDPRTLYAGYQYVFRSRDQGDNWERISPDLTDNSPDSSDHFPFPLQTIVTIAESPLRPGLIYAGTDDGHLHVTTDSGRIWSELSRNLPRKQTIRRVVASALAEGTLYVALGPSNPNDHAASLFKSSDYGKTFTSIANNLPTAPVRVVVEDPSDPNVLYAGTAVGAYITTTGGTQWEVLGNNLPTVNVTDMELHPREKLIVISTYGAGFWALDATLIARARSGTADSASTFRDPREIAMVGSDVREEVDLGFPDWVYSVVLGVALVSLVGMIVCFVWVAVKLFRARGVGWGLLGLIVGPYAFVWGWLNARKLQFAILMTVWSALTLVLITVLVWGMVWG